MNDEEYVKNIKINYFLKLNKQLNPRELKKHK